MKSFSKTYKKFFLEYNFCFGLGFGKCARLFLGGEYINFLKGANSWGSKSNQASFKNMRRFYGTFFSEIIGHFIGIYIFLFYFWV